MIPEIFYLKNIGNVVFSIDSQFHVLKHFVYVDDDYLGLLLKCGYSKPDVESQFDKAGSKFHKEFATNPAVLIGNIQMQIEKQKLKFEWHENKYRVHFSFSKADFPKGIGTGNVFPLNMLSEDEKKRIKITKRDGFDVLSLKKDAQNTWDINLILLKNNGKINVLAAFPGIYAPSLPDRNNQTPGKYTESLTFWNNHVFLI